MLMRGRGGGYDFLSASKDSLSIQFFYLKMLPWEEKFRIQLRCFNHRQSGQLLQLKHFFGMRTFGIKFGLVPNFGAGLKFGLFKICWPLFYFHILYT